MFDGFENTGMNAAILCIWHGEQDWQVWQKYTMSHEPVLFCSSLAKNEPTQIQLEKLKFKELHRSTWVVVVLQLP